MQHDYWDLPSRNGRDQYVEPQDQRRTMRKRTFTRWINVFLQRCQPPLCVDDLFTDIQDGRILLALLEELSGSKLLYRFRSSTHRIFRLSNISKALAFLDDRHVKLLGIDASGIADGNPADVLHLIWIVILHFQIKEVTAGLGRRLSSSLSSLSVSSDPSSDGLSLKENRFSSYSCSSQQGKGRRSAGESKNHRKPISTFLQWLQRCTSKHGIDVRDFGRSWRSGLAFLAVIKSINPDLVDLRHGLTREPKENMLQAFQVAHKSLDIPPLLDPEDVISASDQKSILTYLSMFLHRDSAREKDYSNYEEATSDNTNCGSLDSISYGETLADDPEAEASLRSREECSERLLWKPWSKCPTPVYNPKANMERSCSPASAGASSPKPKKDGGGRVVHPPSPLDAVVDTQQIPFWMEMDGNQQRTEVCLALDSDEEEAYSYILHLNKEVSEPKAPPSSEQIPKIKEETATEMIEQLGTSETLETFPAQNTECDELIGVDWRLDLNLRKRDNEEEIKDNSGLDVDSHAECRNKEQEWKIGDVGFGKDESEELEREMDEAACWQEKEEVEVWAKENMQTSTMKRVREQIHQERKNPETMEFVTEESRKSPEEVVGMDLEPPEGDDRFETRRKRKNWVNTRTLTTPEDCVHRNISDDGDRFPSTPTPSALSSGTDFTLGYLAFVCDITPVELQLLFVLWILLYCLLILS